MRPSRVAARAALIVALASVVGVSGARPQPPTPDQPADQVPGSVVVDAASPAAAILPALEPVLPGPATFVDARTPPAGSAPARPGPTGQVLDAVATPAAASGPDSSAGGWQTDPNVSWYGPGFYGRRTACGQVLTRTLVGVAHRALACGTLVTFRNPANGALVVAPVVDRGPYVSGRQWDLSGALCVALGHCYTGAIEWSLVSTPGAAIPEGGQPRRSAAC